MTTPRSRCMYVEHEGWRVNGGSTLGLVLMGAAAWRLAAGDLVSAAVLSAVGSVLLARSGTVVGHDHSRIQRCPTCDALATFELPATEFSCEACGTTHVVRP